MSERYTPKLPEYMPEWDEIETGYHEYASQVAKQEWSVLDEPPYSFPEEFQDWQEPMHAARRWLRAHDLEVIERVWREAAEVFSTDPEDHVSEPGARAAMLRRADRVAKEGTP